ncbi:MAG: FHA domain-containing protein [Coriobacteriales bacterium]|nr:FHA domain-containing protein [Coriobacteriales bacterium]
MWVCPLDSFENGDDDETCAVCGSPRPAASPDLAATICLRPAPGPHAEKSGGRALVLTELRSQARVVISDAGGVLGREGDYEPELFAPTVSRQHLIVLRRDGGWVIRHVGQNPTVVYTQGEAVKLQKNVSFPLYGGESLKIASMFFDVSLEDVEPDEPASEPAPEHACEAEEQARSADDLVEGWFVDCPVCGAAIRVAGPEQRVRQCPHCIDPFDRRRVGHLRPCEGTRQKDVVVDAG